MTMAAFVDDVAPPLTVLEEGAIAMLAIETEWMRARAAASETLSAGMSGLHAFVAQAQEVGRKDSERSANLSVAAMVFGTLLAVAGGLILVAPLRGPRRPVTEVMKRLAEGGLEVSIEGSERGNEKLGSA